MRDVRMRGFAERADVEDVERLLREQTRVLPEEPVPLDACVGRVLTQDVRAEVDVPGFDRSAMDGYAVRGEDSFGATEYGPLRLALLGESLPGRPFAGRVGPGQAVRIMTGAPVPEGADEARAGPTVRRVVRGAVLRPVVRDSGFLVLVPVLAEDLLELGPADDVRVRVPLLEA